MRLPVVIVELGARKLVLVSKPDVPEVMVQAIWGSVARTASAVTGVKTPATPSEAEDILRRGILRISTGDSDTNIVEARGGETGVGIGNRIAGAADGSGEAFPAGVEEGENQIGAGDRSAEGSGIGDPNFIEVGVGSAKESRADGGQGAAVNEVESDGGVGEDAAVEIADGAEADGGLDGAGRGRAAEAEEEGVFIPLGMVSRIQGGHGVRGEGKGSARRRRESGLSERT